MINPGALSGFNVSWRVTFIPHAWRELSSSHVANMVAELRTQLRSTTNLDEVGFRVTMPVNKIIEVEVDASSDTSHRAMVRTQLIVTGALEALGFVGSVETCLGGRVGRKAKTQTRQEEDFD